ncbi:MAG: cytochrome c [Bacteroidetes bacterium]|nr:MAG: cytochrome c [Bacteroidota bacterium]
MKNNYLSGNIYRVIFLFIFSVILYGCNRDKNKPGWDYFPDMFYSTAYETFSKNPNFNDGMTMRDPVPGTVPRDFIPFEYTNDPESRIKAGIELVNPFLPTTDELVRGKKVYATFCIGCHGIKGEGDGNLFTSGLYPLKPLSISGNTAAKLKDGEIFHTITLGIRSMGAHGSQIRPDDRWKLVLYIRKLQQESAAGSDSGKVK